MTPRTLPIVEERARGDRCCEITVPALSYREVEETADAFDIFAHPVRVRILEILARDGGKVCVCDLEANVPVKQPTVSHHLKLLRQAGLIEWEKRGLWSYYFINKETVRELRMRIIERLNSYI